MTEEVHVRDLGPGEHFGELALLTPGGGGKRFLSIRVKSDHCKLIYLDRADFQKIVGNISKYLKMNYGSEFDQKYFAGLANDPTQNARDMARRQGRRGTAVAGGDKDPMKLKTITGFDATIVVEERSGENGTGSLPSSSSRVDINDGDNGADDEDNEYDLIEDECGDERQELQ